MSGIKLAYHNIAAVEQPHMHGRHAKDMIVLHETESPDYVGWKDIDGVVDYLANKDYGIHGLTDKEAHKAWAYTLGTGIFWQAGGVNERSIGIEQIAPINPTNVAERKKMWKGRRKQLRATAKLVAAISRAQKIPLKYSDGLHPGITTHWDVSQHFTESDGHTDCWPAHKGGFYPVLAVIKFAQAYYRLGYHF